MMPSSISTTLERNVFSCVLVQTVTVVVVQCAGESSTMIFTVTSPSTGILVLLAAPSFRLDGDSCLLSQPMLVHTDSLMTQLDTPVSAEALTGMAYSLVTLVLSWSTRSTTTCTLSTDIRSLVSDA